MFYQIIVLISVFLLLYFSIISDYFNKTFIVILGSVLFLLLNILKSQNIFYYINWNFIIIIICLTFIVLFINKIRIVDFLYYYIFKIKEINYLCLIIFSCIITAFLSALFNNVIIIAIIVPILIDISKKLNVPTSFLVISNIIASNIGGTATVLGSFPNIIINDFSTFDYFNFFMKIFPLVLINFIIFIFVLIFFYNKKYKNFNNLNLESLIIEPINSNKNKVFYFKFALFILFFIFTLNLQIKLYLNLSIILLINVIFLVILFGLNKTEKYIKEIDWNNIIFFIGLFIIIGGLVELGFIKFISIKIFDFGKGNIKLISKVLFWVSSLLSGFLDDVPLSTLLVHFVRNLLKEFYHQKIDAFWWALIFGSSAGAILTPIGSLSSLIAFSICKDKNEKMSVYYKEFFLLGIIVGIINMIISYVYFLLFFI